MTDVLPERLSMVINQGKLRRFHVTPHKGQFVQNEMYIVD